MTVEHSKRQIDLPGDAVLEVPFYIPVTGPAMRPRRSLKSDDSFAILDDHGDIDSASAGSEGLFHADTRYLSRLALLINDTQPLLLGSTLRDDNTVLMVDLTNPDFYAGGRLILPKDTLHIVRTVFLWKNRAYQRFGLQNHGDRPIDVRLSVKFGNDFADIFEVRGVRRKVRGVASVDVAAADRVLLTYRGLDSVIRRTALSFDPAPTVLDKSIAVYSTRLAPHERKPIFVAIDCDSPQVPRPAHFFRDMIRSFHGLKASTHRATTVETSNGVFNELLCRSMADLYMLVTSTPQGPYPYAGVPWYSTTFGRDGLITALQMLWCDPSIAKGVLRRLAAYQAKADDPVADAQPGKILHEMRSGEMAALHEVPFGLYYGSVDSTPLFVLLAGLYAEQTGDVDTLRELWSNVEAALRWIDGPGDSDGDGFVEYSRENEQGLINQGWKDSADSVYHADGRIAHGPIALAEVQAYVFAAKQLAARSARRLGRDAFADALEAQAATLARRFDEAFWCADLGTYALALDGDKKPCRVRTSNAGHALFCGIARPERASQVAEELMRPSSFSGWGVRTVARGEARFNAMSYHNGSIWPHDNALIALGFARYGLKQAVERVFTGQFNAATYMDLRRLPELFCGFQRRRSRGPTLYPVACAPQAWAAATPFALLQASLGLEFDPDHNEIRLLNPRLPPFLGDVLIRNLRLGQSQLDLSIRRQNDDVSIHVVRGSSRIRVCVVYP